MEFNYEYEELPEEVEGELDKDLQKRITGDETLNE